MTWPTGRHSEGRQRRMSYGWLYYIYMSDSTQAGPAFVLTIFFTGMHILRFYFVMELSQGL